MFKSKIVFKNKFSPMHEILSNLIFSQNKNIKQSRLYKKKKITIINQINDRIQ